MSVLLVQLRSSLHTKQADAYFLFYRRWPKPRRRTRQRRSPIAQFDKKLQRERQVEEEAWLEVSLNEDGLVFDKNEISETVEEIVGLCDGE